jgi:hypothetical protein
MEEGPVMLRLCTAALVLLVAAASQAAEVHDYTYFLNELTDLDGLPLAQDGVTCAQASSYDRASKYDPETGEYIQWSANADAGQYIRINEETKEGVMAELEGPGCIFRIWSANPQGVIRFYLDGATKPTYEFNFDKLFSGEIEPFIRPLVWQRKVVLGGGNPASDCYLPIPFAKSCTVTSVILDENGAPLATPGHYYHIGYKLYPKDWQVETFTLPLKPAYINALDETARILNNCGLDPQPTRRARRQASTFRIEPGKTQTIFDLSGPATIHQFFASIDSQDPYATRNAVLRAFWDGGQVPSVLTPLGDFFGRAVGTAEYKSLPLGMTDDMDYCYWRMPFREHGTLTVENQGTEDITLNVRFVYTTGRVPDNACYFHAKWRREPASKTFDYPFVECDGGAGAFVGDLLAIDNIVGGWWGEGDEKFYVDGEKFPSTFGTGSEDYYGDAWGIRWFVNPYHGCPQNEGRKQVVYRWHISDSVPFAKSFEATIENYSAFNNESQNGYASVAYWYQMPGGTDFFAKELPPPDQRLPTAKVMVRGAIEAENVLASSPGAIVLDKAETRDMYSGGKAVASEGAPLNLVVPVERTDVYSIALFEAPDKPLAAGWTLLYDGKPVGKKLSLEKGDHAFTLQRTSDTAGAVTLDYLILVPYRRFITDWLVVGPFDNADDAGYDKPYPPEQKLDLTAEYDVVKGKAKWTKLAAGPEGFVDLDAHFDPNDWVLAYAYTEIVSPAELDTDMVIGSDDGIKIWLNGTLVHDNHVHRGWAPDQDRIAVHLNEGTNTLLVKVDEGGGAWGFSVRIVDPDETLQYQLPSGAAE